MTDKVQKIKEWISKTQDGLMDANGNFEYPEHEGAYHILCNLDAYIDSMQEEPKECMYSKDHYTDKDRKVLCDGCEEECKYAQKEESVSKDYRERYKRIAQSEAFKKTHEGMSIGEVIPIEGEINIPQVFDEGYLEKLSEEPVSEDLEKNKLGR